MRRYYAAVTACTLACLLFAEVRAQATGGRAAASSSSEAAYYVIETIPIPEDVVLEVGGLALLPSGDLAVSTRRGEVWIVENPNGWGDARPFFRRFAHGLHEPLGLAYRDGALYTAQRNELTRLVDTDGDGRADRYETVYDWPVSGNYHEYAFGPVFRENGNMLVSLNLGTEGHMVSPVPWRGWMLEITPEGEMTPIATGMRSPAGFNVTRDGAIFYSENQGDWIGSGWVTHVERGDFVGNPAGLRWTDAPGSPLTLKPEDIPDTGEPMHVVAERVPALKPPAAWFPHGIMGVSTSGILEDTTGGAFGPFAGQLFVGDQGHSKIMRMALEQVDGVYQGAVFPFRDGFQSGVLRMAWSKEGEMYVGMTSRGWDATGGDPYGLQRLRWTGEMPFEAKTIRAMPDGFEIEYTLPVDAAAAADPAAYRVTGFTYKYHHEYGSPVVGQQAHPVRAAVVSDDRKTVRLVVDGLRQGYIHEVKMEGVRSAEGRPLLHDTGYYTLNRIPDGPRLAVTTAPPHAGHTAASPPAGTEPAPEATDAPPAREPAGTPPQPRRLTEMPPTWERADVTVTVGTEPGLRYDLPSFEVKPGARVELAFQNDDDMLHNLLVVRPGTADAVAQEAIELGLEGMAKGFVPDSDDVLFHTALLQPGASERIYFTAPTEPGEYTYVCTFPGHAFTMRGTMYVTP